MKLVFGKHNKFLGIVLLIYGVLLSLYMGYVFFYGYLCQDHAEHLHAAWLVWQGYVPYRDFFEHHNPLLWFVLSPLMPLFYGNYLIFYVAKAITMAVYFIFFAGLYRICRDFLKLRRYAFGLGVAFFFCNKVFIFDLFELRPDCFMFASFIWGLFFYFSFLERGKQKDLNVSFILFSVAFLFLQKILILEGLLGIYTLYLCFRRKISFGAVMKAALIGSIPLLFFWGYLYYTNAWNIYFLFNYELNFFMRKFMGLRRISSEIAEAYFLPGAAMLALHFFLKGEGKRYRDILSGLCLFYYVIVMSTWAPWSQYFFFVNSVFAMITSEVLVCLAKKKIKGKMFILGILLYQTGVFVFQPMNLGFKQYVQLQRVILENSRKNEPIINTPFYFFNIYGSNPSYYWFGYQNIAPVAWYLYGYDDKPDINRMIYENMPKFVFAVSYYNQLVMDNKEGYIEYLQHLGRIYDEVPNKNEGEKAFVNMWGSVYFQLLDTRLLDKYYKITPYFPLMIRKDFDLE